MAGSKRPTAQVPPDKFIDIHIVNEHHSALASNIRLFIETRSYDGRTARTYASHQVPTPSDGKKTPVDVVIFCFDEDTDIPGTLYLLDKTYPEKTVVIGHTLFDDAKMRERLAKSRVKQIVIGYDHTELIGLLEFIAIKLSGPKKPQAT